MDGRQSDTSSKAGVQRNTLASDGRDDSDQLRSSIHRLTAELTGEGGLSAPVKVPRPEALTVRLVNVALLEALDAVRADAALFQNAFYGTFGAAAGLAGNMVLGSTSTAGWIALASSTTASGIFAVLWLRASRLARHAKQQMLSEIVQT
jgi:hypothetical protein